MPSLQNVHKALTTGVVSPDSYRITARGNWLHHTAEAAADPAYNHDENADSYGSVYLWPASSIQCYPGRVLNSFRWIPVAVDRTLLLREWWFYDSSPTADHRQVIDLDWSTTVAEDIDIVASVQRGMSSRGYTPGPLIIDPSGVADMNSENPVLHFHDLVRAALGE